MGIVSADLNVVTPSLIVVNGVSLGIVSTNLKIAVSSLSLLLRWLLICHGDVLVLIVAL